MRGAEPPMSTASPGQAPVAGAFDHAVEMHPPDLYVAAEEADTVQGFEGVTEEHLPQYRSQGFVAIEGAFTMAEVEAARQGLDHLIMGGNPQFKQISFEAWAKEALQTLDLEQRQDAVRKLMYFTPHDDRLRAMAEHPRLIELVRKLLGGEPEMFQDMALLKPPKGREKPWHQDKAYFNIPVGTPVVGVWIALDEVTAANGCMHILPGEHRKGPVIHFKRRDWQICDTEMRGRRATAVPLKPGGCLVFDGLLPHGTPANQTTQRRRALQFHYAPQGAQKMTTEERLAVFGSEGKDVEC
jgi:phytanoyl-CoA hydroxylase